MCGLVPTGDRPPIASPEEKYKYFKEFAGVRRNMVYNECITWRMELAMSVEFEITIEHNDQTIRVSVEGEYTAGYRSRNRFEPSEGAEFEITSITDYENNTIEVDGLDSVSLERIETRGVEVGEDDSYWGDN